MKLGKDKQDGKPTGEPPLHELPALLGPRGRVAGALRWRGQLPEQGLPADVRGAPSLEPRLPSSGAPVRLGPRLRARRPGGGLLGTQPQPEGLLRRRPRRSRHLGRRQLLEPPVHGDALTPPPAPSMPGASKGFGSRLATSLKPAQSLPSALHAPPSEQPRSDFPSSGGRRSSPGGAGSPLAKPRRAFVGPAQPLLMAALFRDCLQFSSAEVLADGRGCPLPRRGSQGRERFCCPFPRRRSPRKVSGSCLRRRPSVVQ